MDNVTVAYERASGPSINAVDNVSIDMEAGSIVALLGPSGCGKTSLLRAIAGLEIPLSGSVSIGGAIVSSDIAGMKREWVQPERRNVGMVFQDGALFPHMTVMQNVVFGLRSQRKTMSKPELLGRVTEMLELVDLVDFADRMPGTLSGGQQQRVALARSLAPQPKVLLLDEPFSALDTALRVQVRAEVARIVRDVGVTTVFVTHDQDEAFVLGDKVAVMRDGVIEQFAAPNELYRTPSTPWVAGFVGEANFVEGTRTSHDAAVADTLLGAVPITSPDTDQLTVQVLVRPEQVGLSALDSVVDAEGCVATIDAVEYYGHDVRYELRLDDGTALAARTKSTELFERGDQVRARFRSRARGVHAASWPS